MSRSYMRATSVRLLILATVGSTIASAVVMACANADSPRIDPGEDSGQQEAGPQDAGATDASSDAISDADADARTPEPVDACSSAGWCATDVDSRLSFDDLWPLEESAVAVASRDGRSSVLRYEGSSWKVIHEVPFLLASVWASTEDVWIAGAGGYVGHGRREGNGWTWTPHPLPVSTPTSVVWGTGARDIYVLADARVWRLPLDGSGAPDAGSWSVDYGDVSGPTPEIKLTALVGRNEDDIWITGERGATFPRCGLVAHKTGGAWVSVIDDRPVGFMCEGPDGGAAFGAPLGKATATADGEIVALAEVSSAIPMSFVRVRHRADAGVEITHVPRTADVKSLWGVSADDLYAASFSVVDRGRDIWTDGGAWQVSTVAFQGIPIVKPFHVVRGTRSDNIWLAGESYVFHKTNP